jgi:endonuclease/exonuclease/phosphatase family metal-dependent hydrolase
MSVAARADVRVITFNTAAGNPRITTPQEQFLELPFYREAFAGGEGAPLLALQEVGDVQAKALRRAHGTAVVLQRRRPGLGNALVIPDRYAVLGHRGGYYVVPQLRGTGHGLRAGRRNWRQYGELRMWIQARLHDRAAGRELTVLTTHVSADGDLKVPQLEAAVRRAERAGPPVVLAGDFNVPAGQERGRDRLAADVIGRLRDMGTPPPGRENIDYVLADGFEPVSCRHWTDILEQRISDHAPEDDVLRYR